MHKLKPLGHAALERQNVGLSDKVVLGHAAMSLIHIKYAESKVGRRGSPETAVWCLVAQQLCDIIVQCVGEI
jgi:hypothetical protein